MQLERLSAVIRPRGPWEALDLGFAMARQWFPALFGLWWLTVLPVGMVGAYWLSESPSLWLLLVWWLKPLYEAPLLFWLSRRLFGEAPGPRALWRARREILPLRLLPNLLWRRLHPSRSFQMPLLLLEGLRGRERRQRQSILQGRGKVAAWLTVICVHLESILWISALLLIVVLIPDELPGFDLSAAFMDEDSTAYWISTLVYCAAMSAIAPFYVAAGFAFYLARRTELEAWDLELQFQQAGEAPLPRVRSAAAGTASVVLLLCFCLAFLPRQAPALTRDAAKAEIDLVLSGTDFGTTREVRTWVYVGSEEEQPGEETDLPDWLAPLLRSVGRGAELAAVVLKWGLILAAAVLVLVILQRILKQLPSLRRVLPASGHSALPSRPMVARTPLQIPTDVGGAVQTLVAAGNTRGALALLYAASIALLHRRHGLDIPESATELECLALVRSTRSAPEVERMQRLVRSWQCLAYAHRPPPRAEIELLVRDWQAWENNADAR